MAITLQVRDARPVIAPKPNPVRTLVFVVAVLGIQLGFILSYVGAFHAPRAEGIEVLVVAPPAVQAQVVDQLNAIPTAPVAASAASSEEAALASLRTADTSGVFIVDATGPQDTLTVASAGGSSIATALTTAFQQVDATQGRTITVQDVLPPQSGDGRGLTGFYLVTGWLVGGYLLAAVLGILLGTTLVGVRQALTRIAVFIPYAVASGIGGALIVDQGLGALTGHFWSVAGVGALVVMSASMVTVGLQSFLGFIGVGITIVLFVVLGNPSAGGAYQQELLPTFWRTISQALPNGAATTAIRHLVYFDAHQVVPDLVSVDPYAITGAALTLLVSAIRGRQAVRS